MTNNAWLPVQLCEDLMALRSELVDAARCIRRRAYEAGDPCIFSEAQSQLRTLRQMKRLLMDGRHELVRKARHDDRLDD